MQNKIDSQLLAADRMRRGVPVAEGVTNLVVELDRDAAGRVLVDIHARVSDELLGEIAKLGGAVVNSFAQYQAIRAALPLAQMEALAAQPGVWFIQPAVRALTNVGSVTTEGDKTHKADIARTTFSVNGAGVKVGVLSDSVDHLSESQASGDLGTVTVLPGQAGSGKGEGTAMLEIIHDLAPGAELYFATGFGSAASFADNIKKLRAAGCDIIVDDVTYGDESPFQDGLIARAVNEVVADGALFFSSAANSGHLTRNQSGTWEGDFVGGDTAANVGQYHLFGSVNNNTVTASGGGGVVLFWADPLGGANNDYDLYLLDSSGANVVTVSNNRQTGSQDPVEARFGNLSQGLRIVVVKYAGSARFLHVDTLRGRLAAATSGSTRGHNAAQSCVGVAAVEAGTSYPNPFTGGAKNPVESFSSDGPRRVFFNPSGTPLTPGNFTASGGTLLQKPDIAAADGGATSVPGFQPFYGTSAAAPHAAAIAALLKSYNHALTAAQIRDALTQSALDIETPGVDRDSGYGLIMAQAALEAVHAPVPPTIASFAPTNGGIGASVTITGTKFDNVSAVKFAGVTATFTVNSGTQILATVPTAAVTGRITVSTTGGTATSASDFGVLSTPAIASFSPTSGAAGSAVVVAGAHFAGATSVKFNGVSAPFTVNSATQITATVPAGATTGRITVTAPSGTATSSGNFTVTTVPAITGFSPASGGVGALVTLSGANLSEATSVRFNGVSAGSFTVDSAAQITATVPVGATTGPISVTTASGTATSAAAFGVVSGPMISGFTPSSGPVGTEVGIAGQNLTGALSVRFQGTEAYTFLVQSPSQILTVVPPGATTGPVSVTTSGGVATSVESFSVVARPANDDFADARAISGSSGTTSDNTMAATKEPGEPSHAGNPGGHSVWYRWTPPGAGSYRFDTAGSDFDTLLGIYTGTTLSNLTLVAQSDDVSDTNRTSMVTILANSGTTYSIAVDGHSLEGGEATNGTYGVVSLHWASVPSAPVVTGFAPASGLAGTPVVIAGANFNGATAVLFGGGGAGFTVNSSSQITASVPSGAITGAITVLTPAGAAVSTANFTVIGVVNNDQLADAQGLVGASGSFSGNNEFASKEPGEPSHAGNAGGRSVWYRWTAPASGLWTFDTTGSDFDTLLGIYTGTGINTLKQEASNDDIVGGRTSEVTLAATVGSTYLVAVDGYGGAGGNVVLNWRTAARLPRITGFNPASGSPGTVVRVTGANFTGATRVRFQEVGASFTVDADTQITATVPPGAQTGPISVTTLEGRGDSSAEFGVGSTASNDQFANAQFLSGALAVAAGGNVGATLEDGEPDHAGMPGGHSVWYRWTAPSNGTWTVDLSGSRFDTLLGIYTGGSVSSLIPIAWDDDSGAGVTSKATFIASSGATYRIAVDGYGGATGDVALRIFPAQPGQMIYGTDFEMSDGFYWGFPLDGAGGWTSYGSGGNGILFGYLPGYGQNAYIGYTPPSTPGDTLYIWKPLDYTPNVNALPVVRFSVVMNIMDSLNYEYDDFDWQVFNREGNRLFTLNFDNSNLSIYHRLSGSASPFVDTGYTFENGETYALAIVMDFGANLWSAFVNTTQVVTNQPISVGGSALTLGDIDAVWNPRDDSAPGDNYMLFDDYVVTAEGSRAPAILLQPQGQSVGLGGTATFGVVARGEEPLAYQWRLEGANLPAATGPVLALAGVTAAQAGHYSVVVGNAAGTAVSQDAILTVALPPNLRPWQPTGWSAPLVVAVLTNTTTDAASFRVGQTLYLNWAVDNDSDGAVTNRFYVRLFLDNALRHEWHADSLAAHHYAYITDYNLGSLSVGGHVLRLEADATGAVEEANENDNTFLKTIFVAPAVSAPPQLGDGKFPVPGTFQFWLSGESGRTYTVQVSTNLVNWASLTEVAGAEAPVLVSDPGAAGHTSRFYRALVIGP